MADLASSSGRFAPALSGAFRTDLSVTSLRHPLASKRVMVQFGGADTGTCEQFEMFELLSRYDVEAGISRGTFGFVARASDRKRVEEYNLLPEAERAEGGEEEAEQRFQTFTRCAVKKVPHIFESGEPRMWLSAARELNMLLSFDHANVISATDFFIPLGDATALTPEKIARRRREFQEIYLVMPFKDYTLRQVIDNSTIEPEQAEAAAAAGFTAANHPILEPVHRSTPLHPLARDYRKFIFYQIVRGVAYLHLRGVVHRDLKPENVLIDYEFKASICDFGQSRVVGASTLSSPGLNASSATDDAAGRSAAHDLGVTSLTNCTQWYAAPETLGAGIDHAGAAGHVDKQLMESADVWSLGCIAAEMLIGRPLFYTASRGGPPQLRAIRERLGDPDEMELAAMSTSRVESDRASFRDFFSSPTNNNSNGNGRKSGGGVPAAAATAEPPSDGTAATVAPTSSGAAAAADTPTTPRQASEAVFAREQSLAAGLATIALRRLQNELRVSPLGEEVDDDEVELIASMVQYDPTRRPALRDVLRHPWFAKDEYEPTICADPEAEAAAEADPMRAVAKSEVATETQGREFLWQLFLRRHPEVVELIDVLSAQAGSAPASAAAAAAA